MKKNEATIKPFKLKDAKAVIAHLGVQELTEREIESFGREKGYAEIYRGSEYTVDFLPEVKLEVVFSDGQTGGAVEAILKSAKPGKIDDGKVFVLPVESATRIRTGGIP